MSVAKCIEVIAQSEKGWEDAAQEALKEVSKTVHGIQSLWVKEMQAIVEDGRISSYRLSAKITFLVDR
jgi:dodecin